MVRESRTAKSIKNAKVSLIFYVLSLAVTFFSRKLFLQYLGDDFVGLTGTLNNILGFLNLAELGVSSAIGFLLYAPLQKTEYSKIKDLISAFGFLYRRIGLIILAVSLAFSCFIPLIFRDATIHLPVIFFAFYSFLTASLLSYFCNYKQTLLAADQKNYVIVCFAQTGILIKTIVQIILVLYSRNYYLWISVELVYGITYSIVLNRRIRKEYPWLQVQIKKGRQLLKQYSEIYGYTRQIFIHKIKDFLLAQGDQIFVFVFVSLKMVAYYGNYVLITSKLGQLASAALDSVTASVGNLVAENNRERIHKVFWELMSVRYYLAGIMVFSLYFLLEPFITLWLGREYVLSQTVLILFLVNLFIMQSRGAVDSFNIAYGLYADTWSAWVEGILNVAITFSLSFRYGIVGILLGKAISTFFIIVLWKPYYLFSQGLKSSIWTYWKGVGRYYVAFILSAVAIGLLLKIVAINPFSGFLHWLFFAVVATASFSLFYMGMLLLCAPGMKDFLLRFSLCRKIQSLIR